MVGSGDDVTESHPVVHEGTRTGPSNANMSSIFIFLISIIFLLGGCVALIPGRDLSLVNRTIAANILPFVKANY